MPPTPVTVPVPHPGTKINKPILDQLVTRGLFLGIKPYASLVAYSEEGGTGIPGRNNPSQASKLPKYFVSLSNLGIFIDGSLTLDSPNARAFSDESFSIYSGTLGNFYRARVIANDSAFMVNGVFTIPRLVVRELPDHGLLNFDLDAKYTADAVAAGKSVSQAEQELREGREVTTLEQPWSFGFLLPDFTGPYERNGEKFRPTFPSNHGLKFENGKPVVFDYQQYDAAFPIVTKVSVGGGGGALGKPQVKPGQSTAFLQSAGMAAFGSPSNHEAAVAKILADFVEVK